MLFKNAVRLHSMQEKLRISTGRMSSYLENKPFILGVGGGSCSGKTTFCDNIIDLFGKDNIIYLSQDDYYKNFANSSEKLCHVFDEPQSIEFDLLCNQIDDLAVGCDISIPEYDFNLAKRRSIRAIYNYAPIIIVDGSFVLSNKDLQKRFDKTIYIDTSDNIRYHRRIIKDAKKFGYATATVEKTFNEVVLPIHKLHVEPQKNIANEIISGEINDDNIIFNIFSRMLEDIFMSNKKK